MSMLAAFMDGIGAERHVRRRVVAGVVVALLALSGIATLWVTRRGDDDASQVPAYVPPRVPTVWPESGLAGEDSAQDVQARADDRDPDVVWRLRPDRVVHAFVASVLGWSDPTVHEIEPGAGGALRWYMATQATCPDFPFCPFVSPARSPTLRIAVTQPATRGEEGIWSVAVVRSSDLRIAAKADTSGGIAIGGSAGRAVGLHTLAGARWYDGCRIRHRIRDDVRRPARFWVNGVDVGTSLGCSSVAAGYAYIYAVDSITQPVGDPLLESAPLVDLTIVPIRVRVAA